MSLVDLSVEERGFAPTSIALAIRTIATSMVMRWRSLVAGTVSVLEATRQLSASSPSAAIIAPRRHLATIRR